MSYGGRLNALTSTTTRIFSGRNASDTPVGCDDDDAPPNHFETVNIVFLDTSARSYFYSLDPAKTEPELGGARIGSGILTECGN